MRKLSLAIGVVIATCLLAAAIPAGAITGGTDDDPSDPKHPNVGLLFFYQSDGRFRCSATLISPRVLLTAAHCTFGDIGKVAVTFDTQVAQDAAAGRSVLPRAEDDLGLGLEGSGYTQGLWTVEYDAAGNPLPDLGTPDPDDVLHHPFDNSGGADATADGRPVWITGTPLTHPDYSDFTDIKNWNDTGVVILDQPVPDDVPIARLAPASYLDGFTQNRLIKELVETVGYGTEVRQPASGPQKPTPMSYPLRRQYTLEKPQKLTAQILQLQGNEHDPFGGGGTCFGDSGGPAFHGGYVVGDTSYGYTDNCRYLGGYQRVDIPIVRSWLTCVLGVAEQRERHRAARRAHAGCASGRGRLRHQGLTGTAQPAGGSASAATHSPAASSHRSQRSVTSFHCAPAGPSVGSGARATSSTGMCWNSISSACRRSRASVGAIGFSSSGAMPSPGSPTTTQACDASSHCSQRRCSSSHCAPGTGGSPGEAVRARSSTGSSGPSPT